MGFLKKIFKKKKGGTFFGNLMRGVASSYTGGILGSGAGLAKSDAMFQAKEDAAYLASLQTPAYVPPSAPPMNSNQLGSYLGAPLQPHFEKLVDKGVNSKTGEAVQKVLLKVWLKENWWKILIPVVLITGIIVLIVKNKK